MRALDAGESFVITRNGVPVGELTPVRRHRFVARDAAIAMFRAAAPIDRCRSPRSLSPNSPPARMPPLIPPSARAGNSACNWPKPRLTRCRLTPTVHVRSAWSMQRPHTPAANRAVHVRSICSSPPPHLPQTFPYYTANAADFAVLTELIELEPITLAPA